MKLKEINNLFNEIDYFKGIDNKDDYFHEFIYLYGERDLLFKVEMLYNEKGVSGVGKLFSLKTKKWIEISTLDEKINALETTDRTVLTTGTKRNTGGKTRQTNSNNINEVTPFDVVESIQNEQNNNTIEEVESNSDDLSSENKIVYSGFSKEKIDYFIKKFKNYSEYRYIIYNDIINMITLQIY
jgi:hypothetical protein